MNKTSLKLLLKNKGFWISTIFYFYLIFGFVIAATIGNYFQLDITATATIFLITFIPILVLKLSYESKRSKIKNQEFYNKK
ncbi:hypothetical protein ACHJH3_06055 [Campylobacter sp. MOP7]|uniref:hypothetical protein n=1 Tax=Campylobacter canis TaxID=3378588 RepID=UPI00387ECFEA